MLYIFFPCYSTIYYIGMTLYISEVTLLSSANKLHKLMTIALVRKFNMDGFNILAATNFPDLNVPEKIGRHSPDVIAMDFEGTYHFGEAKVYRNLDTEKTKEQFFDFLTYICPSGKQPHLHIIVEMDYEVYLNELLIKWRIISNRIHIWTY